MSTRRGLARPIYGVSKRIATKPPPLVCSPEDVCLTPDLLEKFISIVELTETLVRENYKPGATISMIVAQMPARARVNDYIFVRFMWLSRQPPNTVFDYTNPDLPYEIKDIYLSYGMTSWINDPLVKDLPTR
jgi:hypothetical protein